MHRISIWTPYCRYPSECGKPKCNFTPSFRCSTIKCKLSNIVSTFSSSRKIILPLEYALCSRPHFDYDAVAPPHRRHHRSGPSFQFTTLNYLHINKYIFAASDGVDGGREHGAHVIRCRAFAVHSLVSSRCGDGARSHMLRRVAVVSVSVGVFVCAPPVHCVCLSSLRAYRRPWCIRRARPHFGAENAV